MYHYKAFLCFDKNRMIPTQFKAVSKKILLKHVDHLMINEF